MHFFWASISSYLLLLNKTKIYLTKLQGKFHEQNGFEKKWRVEGESPLPLPPDVAADRSSTLIGGRRGEVCRWLLSLGLCIHEHVCRRGGGVLWNCTRCVVVWSNPYHEMVSNDDQALQHPILDLLKATSGLHFRKPFLLQ